MNTKHKLLVSAIGLLATIALGVSGYLTYVTWQQETVLGCTAGSGLDCEDVLGSGWSKWLGMPVSMFGAAVYVGILGLCWPAVRKPNSWAAAGLVALALMAAGAGLWFLGTQVLVLQQFCLYCLAVHTCGGLILAATLLLILDPGQANNLDQMRSHFGVVAQSEPPAATSMSLRSMCIALGIAASGLMALIAGQLLVSPPTMEVVEIAPAKQDAESTQKVVPPVASNAEVQNTELEKQVEPKEEDSPVATEQPSPAEKLVTPQSTYRAPRYVNFSSLKSKVDVNRSPVLGNPEAEHMVVEILDYTCPHCRKLHPFVQKALDRYGDQLGVVVFHLPLSRKCNPIIKAEHVSHANGCGYARFAYGVWKLSPRHFAEYHDWLMEGEKAPPLHVARQRALDLVGEQILLDQSIELDSKKMIVDHSNELNVLNLGLPVVVFQSGVIKGSPESDEKWYEVLEERVGVKPPEKSND